MKVQFLGATRKVTGSCFMVSVNGSQVLIDCGLLQGSRSDEMHNADAFPFEASDIDAVILTHAHIDHSGRIPLLVKRGFRGPVYTHHASADLCRVMLADSGFLHERQAAWENRRRNAQKQVEPVYDRHDAETAQRQFVGLDYGLTSEILPCISITLYDAGHILGSAIVEVRLTEMSQHKTIVFSGDLGHSGAPLLREPTQMSQADLVVMESTYGDRQHRGWQETWEEMGNVLSAANASRGNILIPAFTVGRTQELLRVFKENFEAWGLDHWQIFLDSPMAIEATEIYEKHWRLLDKETQAVAGHGSIFDLPNLHISESTEDSIGINRIRSGAIIIAGSGMCTGGRIRHHLKYNISRKDSHIVMVGYQAGGTTGRQLVDGAESVSLFGERHQVSARVHTIGGLSAHADQQGLLGWYSSFPGRPPVKLVHGEEEAMHTLQQALSDRFQANVTLAEQGETTYLK
jgi:metallo-beta-lactamase family protein